MSYVSPDETRYLWDTPEAQVAFLNDRQGPRVEVRQTDTDKPLEVTAELADRIISARSHVETVLYVPPTETTAADSPWPRPTN